MSRVKLTGSARADLAEIRKFYEHQDKGAGDYFITQAAESLMDLQNIHGIHPKKFGFHRMLIPRFHHAIFYREHPDVTEVLAIVDLRRDPASIKRQLRHR